MMGGEAIINPEAEPGEARLSPRALLTFARPDYHLLGRLVQARDLAARLILTTVAQWEPDDV